MANNPGTGLHQFNWPMRVSAAGGKVVVADTNNDRILIWNSFPTQNSQAAHVNIDLRELGRKYGLGNLKWPWGVWTDGAKLAVASTHGDTRVLLWNTFPTKADEKPDVALTANGKFGTPRAITSNGQYLIVSDHNAKAPTPTSLRMGNIGGSATFVWKAWPTSDDQPYDFVIDGSRAGTFLSDNKLILISTTHFPPSIWNAPPTDVDDTPDLIIGNGSGVFAEGYYFIGGDGGGPAFAGGRLYIAIGNGNKVVVYNTIPTDTLKIPDFAIGAPDVNTNTLETNFFIANPQMATDGKSLFAVSNFNRKLYFWKSLPDESGAHPDFVYDLFGPRGNINFQASAIAMGQNALVLGGRAAGDKPTVYVWKKIPLSSEVPDVQFQGKIGSVELKGPNVGIAIDDKYFYLSDGPAGKIYVWEGIPDSLSEPKFTLNAAFPGSLHSDGKHLVSIVNVNQPPTSHTVGIWEISKLSSSSKPNILPIDPQDIARRFNGIGGAIVKDDHLLIADTGFGRVLAWTNINDALAGEKADIVLGAKDLDETVQEIGKDKLFWPASMAFDGSFLWVGEFKFSGRILRFSVH
ncbi:hypothetical protein HY502_03540 [Candidatus Woesebacteria bacterium]|nr:hypothetical protein [Candidatus Woesebacteria bacterium]